MLGSSRVGESETVRTLLHKLSAPHALLIGIVVFNDFENGSMTNLSPELDKLISVVISTLLRISEYMIV